MNLRSLSISQKIFERTFLRLLRVVVAYMNECFAVQCLIVVAILICAAQNGNAEALSTEKEAITDTLQIQGLTFTCANCRQTDDRLCEIVVSKERILMPCDQAMDVLLNKAVKDGDTHPRPDELIRYLLNQSFIGQSVAESRSAARIQSCLQLLFATDKGVRAFEKSSSVLLAQFESAIEAVLFQDWQQRERGDKSEKVHPNIYKSLWALDTKGALSLSFRLRSMVGAHIPEFDLSTLLRELSAVDVDHDLDLLKDLRSYIGTLKPDWIEPLDVTLRVLNACTAAHEPKDIQLWCGAKELQTIPESVRSYVLRAEVGSVFAWIRKTVPPPQVGMMALSVTDSVSSRTPEMHAYIEKALEELLASSEKQELIQMWNSDFENWIVDFAKHDQRIQDLALDAFDTVAKDQIQRNDIAATLATLERSVQAFPVAHTGRDSLLHELANDPRVYASGQLPIVEHLMTQSGTITQNARMRTIRVLSVIALFLWFVLYQRFTRKKSQKDAATVTSLSLNAEERQELRDLCRFFSVSPLVRERELSQSYKKRAKELHPDIYGGNVDGFRLLTTKYERAKQLIERRSVSLSH